jgi:hypothetical protein
LETELEMNDEYDGMADFEIHLEFDLNEVEECKSNELSWQDFCEILS